ncbi:MAG: SpoIIE family protein phosphatase [Leptospiraceae bacterium]|nr:SpoIIE family protein phosphatase [Leptospiraceae bacterium]MCP5510376.1 SpoIIE family protein phosphatase [Leptospiraceae bacterium]
MESILLSFHSLGVFLAYLILSIQTIFLLIKKDKTYPTYWLIGVFFGFTVMLFGYFLAYSYYSPAGAFHRYMTVFVLFGNASFVGFSYHFPKNDFPKESRIVIPLGFLIAFFAYLHFVSSTLKMTPHYNSNAHFYTFNFGATTAIFILLLFLIAMTVLIRKTILYSDYDGFFNDWMEKKEERNFLSLLLHHISKFFVFFIKLYHPRGKEAFHIRTFVIIIILLILTAITNVLNKNGILSYNAYAMYYSNSTLVICFAMLMAYINSSGEPTTFMIKLVGISLVTVLLVLGFMSNITLTLNETVYDNKNLAQVEANREMILNGDYSHLPDEIRFIISVPQESDLTTPERAVNLLYTHPDEDLDLEKIRKGEERELDYLIHELEEKIRRKNPLAPENEIRFMAVEAFKNTKPYKNIAESFQNEKNRHYREIGNHYIYYEIQTDFNRYEIGYSYYEYRKHVHTLVLNLIYLVLITTFLIFVVFPRFFKSSLVKPLNKLLEGVKQVNEGDLNVVVPIKVQDEIGFLADSFNGMVKSIQQARMELQDYANTLEDKVAERTKEVEEKMNEVHALKVQQDGDYFLTSLLTKPLFINSNKSERVLTEFLISQKKKFEFRNRSAELGGDLCITGNLKLGKPNDFRQYTVAINGDAMGKSMQGAGGSLVMGVVMNSIMARSAANKRILDMNPEQWISEAYTECNNVFKSFNGTMVLSATVVVIDDLSGDMYYWNAEHPFSILYRDKTSSFIEESLQLRKLGLDSEYEFKVHRFKLHPGDILLLGSDGRDDIDLTPGESMRTINDDETMILGIVDEAECDLNQIKSLLEDKGTITDDLSFLKISFLPNGGEVYDSLKSEAELLYEKAAELYRSGKQIDSYEFLKANFEKHIEDSHLTKLTGLVAFKNKDYQTASQCFSSLLENDSKEIEILYFHSISLKRIGEIDRSIEVAEKIQTLEPENISNLIHLADLYRIQNLPEKAMSLIQSVLEKEPENKNALKIYELLKQD